MSELLHKLGLDWRLFLAQVLNFLVVLVILRLTVYKPVIRLLAERRTKIEKGLSDAAAAEGHLAAVEATGKQRLAAVETESVKRIAEAEAKAKARGEVLMQAAHTKESEIIAAAEKVAQARRSEAESAFYAQAADVVRAAVAKTATLDPDAVDKALVTKALEALRRTGNYIL